MRFSPCLIPAPGSAASSHRQTHVRPARSGRADNRPAVQVRTPSCSSHGPSGSGKDRPGRTHRWPTGDKAAARRRIWRPRSGPATLRSGCRSRQCGWGPAPKRTRREIEAKKIIGARAETQQTLDDAMGRETSVRVTFAKSTERVRELEKEMDDRKLLATYETEIEQVSRERVASRQRAAGLMIGNR